MIFFSEENASRSSGENAIDLVLVVGEMRASCVCVEVSQKVMLSFVEHAMNFPCCGSAMHEMES